MSDRKALNRPVVCVVVSERLVGRRPHDKCQANEGVRNAARGEDFSVGIRRCIAARVSPPANGLKAYGVVHTGNAGISLKNLVRLAKPRVLVGD